MKSKRACIVSTVKNPGNGFESFLKYHLKIGFEKLYIFFDDPKDSAIAVAKKIPGVVSILCNNSYKNKIKKLPRYKELKKHLQGEITARQEINADFAMQLALKDKCDWIFHIDSDELICNYSNLPIGKLLAQVPDDIDQLLCENLEAAPQSVDIDNPFTEVTLFKKNFFTMVHSTKAETIKIEFNKISKKQLGLLEKYFKNRNYYTGYDQGKCGARVSPLTTLLNVHLFGKAKDKTFKQKEFEHVPTSLVQALSVYHYQNCGFVEYLEKYRNVNPNEKRWWFKGKMMGFRAASTEAFQNRDFKLLFNIYKWNIQLSDPKLIKILLGAKIVEKNTKISKIIERL